jgi:hypothetical protein
MFDQSQIEPNL